jgi:hypothetical protein
MPLGAVSDYLCHCTRLAKLNHRAAEGAEFLSEIVSYDGNHTPSSAAKLTQAASAVVF